MTPMCRMRFRDVRSLNALATVRAGFIAALLAINAASFATQRPALAEPQPQPAVTAIVQALEDHRLVAIGEMHRNQQVHDLLVRLLTNPGAEWLQTNRQGAKDAKKRQGGFWLR